MGGTLTIKPNSPVLKDMHKKDGSRRQVEVEDAVNIPRGRLTQYERGMPMSLDHLELLAEYYNVSPESLTREDSVNTIRELAMRIQKLFGAVLSESNGK